MAAPDIVMYEEEFNQIKQICSKLPSRRQRQGRLPRRQERSADRRARRDREPRHHLARLADRRQRRRHRRNRQAARREGVRDPLPRGREGQHPHLHRRAARHPGRDLRRALVARAGSPARQEGHRRARRQSSNQIDGEGCLREGRRHGRVRVPVRRDHRRGHRQPLQRVGDPATMTFINYASREINCKIVYYGPGLCGKTTNLQYIYDKTNPEAKGKMISLATETERTLFFDFLPLDARRDPRLQDPLPPLHRARAGLLRREPQADPQGRRRRRLRGRLADRAHGSEHRVAREPEENLAGAGLRSRQTIPYVVQYNKRDLPNAVPVGEM